MVDVWNKLAQDFDELGSQLAEHSWKADCSVSTLSNAADANVSIGDVMTSAAVTNTHNRPPVLHNHLTEIFCYKRSGNTAASLGSMDRPRYSRGLVDRRYPSSTDNPPRSQDGVSFSQRVIPPTAETVMAQLDSRNIELRAKEVEAYEQKRTAESTAHEFHQCRCSLRQANNRVKELEIEVNRLRNTVEDYSCTIRQLQQQNAAYRRSFWRVETQVVDVPSHDDSRVKDNAMLLQRLRESETRLRLFQQRSKDLQEQLESFVSGDAVSCDPWPGRVPLGPTYIMPPIAFNSRGNTSDSAHSPNPTTNGNRNYPPRDSDGRHIIPKAIRWTPFQYCLPYGTKNVATQNAPPNKLLQVELTSGVPGQNFTHFPFSSIEAGASLTALRVQQNPRSSHSSGSSAGRVPQPPIVIASNEASVSSQQQGLCSSSNGPGTQAFNNRSVALSPGEGSAGHNSPTEEVVGVPRRCQPIESPMSARTVRSAPGITSSFKGNHVWTCGTMPRSLEIAYACHSDSALDRILAEQKPNPLNICKQ